MCSEQLGMVKFQIMLRPSAVVISDLDFGRREENGVLLVAMEEMAVDPIPVDVDADFNDNEDEGMWYDASMTSPQR